MSTVSSLRQYGLILTKFKVKLQVRAGSSSVERLIRIEEVVGPIPIRSTNMKVVVASNNPIKIRASLTAFRKMFPGETFQVEGVTVPSGVSDQPSSDAETLQGACNRADQASKINSQADYWVGIEGGIEAKSGEMEAFAWVVVKSVTGKIGKGKTGTFFLPPKVAELINQGMELGKADDIVFDRANSKQENGAVGILTNDLIDRTKFYTDAVVLALIPFNNEELYH